MSAQQGFDTIVLDRIGFNLKIEAAESRSLEFVWQTDSDASHSPRNSLLAHVLDVPGLLYIPPVSFDFEYIDQIDPAVTTENLSRRAEALMLQMFARAPSFTHNLLLVTYGNDFHYQHADWMFGNMSMLIKYINANHGDQLVLQYATLSEYFDALHAVQGDGFPVRSIAHDFHPYSWTPNDENSWDGFLFQSALVNIS